MPHDVVGTVVSCQQPLSLLFTNAGSTPSSASRQHAVRTNTTANSLEVANHTINQTFKPILFDLILYIPSTIFQL